LLAIKFILPLLREDLLFPMGYGYRSIISNCGRGGGANDIGCGLVVWKW